MAPPALPATGVWGSGSPHCRPQSHAPASASRPEGDLEKGARSLPSQRSPARPYTYLHPTLPWSQGRFTRETLTSGPWRKRKCLFDFPPTPNRVNGRVDPPLSTAPVTFVTQRALPRSLVKCPSDHYLPGLVLFVFSPVITPFPWKPLGFPNLHAHTNILALDEN